MTKMTTVSMVVPKGVYYLGDPCYMVPDELWMPLLEDSDYFDQPSGVVNGHTVYAFHTLYGDGEYKDQYGNSYPVDAGLIGLVPIELPDAATKAQHDGASQLVTFSNPTVCICDEGLLKFGHILIDTRDEEEDEVDEWEEVFSEEGDDDE